MTTALRLPKQACPVAALIGELAENVDLQARIRARPDAEDDDLPGVLSVLGDRQSAIQAFVETGRATGLKGAALQLVMLHNAAADMGAALPEGRPAWAERDKGQLNRAVDTVAYQPWRLYKPPVVNSRRRLLGTTCRLRPPPEPRDWWRVASRLA